MNLSSFKIIKLKRGIHPAATNEGIIVIPIDVRHVVHLHWSILHSYHLDRKINRNLTGFGKPNITNFLIIIFSPLLKAAFGYLNKIWAIKENAN